MDNTPFYKRSAFWKGVAFGVVAGFLFVFLA